MNKPLITEANAIRVTISYTNPILRWILSKASITIEAVVEDQDDEGVIND